jgi:hypothetical protein
LGALALVVAAGVVLALTNPFKTSPATNAGVADTTTATSLATVTRQNLTSQTEVAATLGYADSFTVVNQDGGGAVPTSGPAQSGSSGATFTSLPAVGQVVSQGQVLYQVNGVPVFLIYGSTPAYRSLTEGESGADVEELNYDLVALGEYPHGEGRPTSDVFNAATAYGVRRFQATHGVTPTGTFSLGQVVFLPTSTRIISVSATLGSPAQVGQPVLSATSTTRQVSIALDASQQSEVAVGDKVDITLPNNQSTPGVVASVGTVASTPASGSSSSNPTITVLVTPTDPAATGSWDQAPVNVTITTAHVNNVLVVPITALLALSGGGYSVETVGSNGIHHLVPVSLGLFDDAEGLVQVSSSGLALGQRVVVPSS